MAESSDAKNVSAMDTDQVPESSSSAPRRRSGRRMNTGHYQHTPQFKANYRRKLAAMRRPAVMKGVRERYLQRMNDRAWNASTPDATKQRYIHSLDQLIKYADTVSASAIWDHLPMDTGNFNYIYIIVEQAIEISKLRETAARKQALKMMADLAALGAT